jgi:hypothetical protein
MNEDYECFECLSMNGKFFDDSKPAPFALSPSKGSERVFQLVLLPA